MDELSCIGLASSGWVLSGGDMDIQAYPQVDFKPHGLFIPNYISEYFIINHIQVGWRMSPQVAPGDLPAQLFEMDLAREDVECFFPDDGRMVRIRVERKCDLLRGRRWAFPVCKAGERLSMRVTNIAGIAFQFRAVFIGEEISKELLLKSNPQNPSFITNKVYSVDQKPCYYCGGMPCKCGALPPISEENT